MQRRPILAIACLGMTTFAIVLTSLGASLHTLIARFGIDKAQAGGLLSLLSFWILVGSIVFGPVVDRRGYRGVLLFSFAAIVAGLEMIAFAPSLYWLRAGIAVVGVSGGLVNGATNALVADVSGEQRGADLALVGAFYGVGAVGVPFLLSSLSWTFSTQTILAAIPAFVILPFALTGTAAFPAAKQPKGLPIADARRLLRDPVLLLMGLILLLESGMESTVGGWTTLLFAEEMQVSANRAPMYLALFWLGLLLTRLVLGFTLRPAARTRVLFVSLAVGAVSSLVLISTRNVAAAGAAVFCLGAGFAPMFPVVYGLVAERYEQLSGTALGIVIAMALVGGTLMPWATGVLGDAYGLRTALAVVPASLIVLAILLGTLARRSFR
jgi:FHS family glucose/mannose:H+ symporter-like MFS transporter